MPDPAPTPLILLVDDEPLLLRALLRLLQRHGISALTAGNGLEALQALQTVRPNLIICDVRMPVLDGPGLLRELRARGDNFPPFVFLTGYGDRSDAELLALGAKEVHGKPIDRAELLKLVERWSHLAA